jgi:trimeric autotransporter adhesin
MTRNNRSFRISPALVISCVALFMALTGSALAVGIAKNSVRSAQIVDGSVRSIDLRDNAVNAAKIAPGSVASEELAENAVASPEVAPDSLTNQDLGAASVASPEVADQSLTAADLGPDSVSASELGTVTLRTNSAKVPKDGSGSVSANCAAGEQVLSGGGQPSHFGTEMTSSRPSGNGWLYQALNKTGGEDTITAFVLCLAS